MGRHGGSQASRLEQWVRCVLPVVMLAAAVVVLWAAALSAAVRCGRSPDQVTLYAASSDVTRC